ncbi:hypothetical protein P691DRAFT_762285 [Macrolepiota fuliginosa MF-IS2]|uniref:Nephrocystin 3-like N-terminal domain-containing protein n=1 Tax=Macrolepiota fuliginosa MF-IS2 TaxID=1400762 RepID=A0A9P5X6Y3_9AGAR|nr:hypothetical protein P691DRAFT_762285 [Macrolepiota fuliginosa MF-IS2]
MLSNANNIVLNNCHLVEHNAAERSGLKILHSASLPSAAYDSAARESALYSIPKTEHEGFVTEFVTWAHRADSLVMRLNGPKSNLAQLCMEELQEELAASFCSPQSQGVDDPCRVFITLADQLATHIPAYAKSLDARLRHNPALVTKSLKVQFHELIAAPIKELLDKRVELGPRKLIVVEGIDECTVLQAQHQILSIILRSAADLPFHWAIFGQQNHLLETMLKEQGPTTIESCWNVRHSAPGLPVSEGEFFHVETIRYQGWIAVRWTLVTHVSEAPRSPIIEPSADTHVSPQQLSSVTHLDPGGPI